MVLEQFFKGLALDVLHSDVCNTVIFTVVIDDNNIIMGHLAGSLSFPFKAGEDCIFFRAVE